LWLDGDTKIECKLRLVLIIQVAKNTPCLAVRDNGDRDSQAGVIEIVDGLTGDTSSLGLRGEESGTLVLNEGAAKERVVSAGGAGPLALK
jgi:hypothetical protein